MLRQTVSAKIVVVSLLFAWTTSAVLSQSSDAVATLSRAASVPVQIHRGAGSGALLQLWISGYTPPRRGTVEAVVSLVRGASKKEVEIGRFVIYPSEPFIAKDAAEQRGYSFDAAQALISPVSSSDELAVHVRLVPLSEGMIPEGAQLTVARAELRPQPKPE
jgi:hypothetical protein